MSAGVQYRPTEMEISRGALRDNARLLKQRLGGKARLMAVVKADAYGHGAVETARAALAGGADQLAVALVEEGVQLRQAGVRAPILVLGGATPQGAREAVAANLAVALYDREVLAAMQSQAAKLDCVAHAHVKIDTGMSRVGVAPGQELDGLIGAMKACPRVKCEGAFTHFAAADSDEDFTRWQNGRFSQGLTQLRGAGFRPMAHAAASDAMLRDESLWHDMVRPGIALYGASVRHYLPGLTPAQRLTTRPLRLAWIQPGDTVGYGRTFTAVQPTLVATLPIGYGDGYPRALSGKATALVKGQRCAQIGRVCMDLMMIDVTHIPGVTLEDEVVLLGSQGDQRITPDELAILADTIPYEIMLGFGPRVPRHWLP